MWTMVWRMLAVFAFWGAALVGAVAAGLSPRPAELAAAALAGATLALMSLRPPKPDAADTHAEQVDSAREDERRSVS